MFFYELGTWARVVESDGTMVGFLLGFVTESKLGYVHLVGIHPQYRRRGVARLLYSSFEQACRAAGCTRLKAITTHGNEGSVRFHQALDWTVTEIADYAGPGRARVVFEKTLG
jgi:ribosomal protein S18 acetylase RimI-like enzyme